MKSSKKVIKPPTSPTAIKFTVDGVEYPNRRDACRATGVNYQSVYSYMYNHNVAFDEAFDYIRNGGTFAWTEEYIEILKREYPIHGKNIPELLTVTSKAAIGTKASKLGLHFVGEDDGTATRYIYVTFEGKRVSLMTVRKKLGISKDTFANIKVVLGLTWQDIVDRLYKMHVRTETGYARTVTHFVYDETKYIHRNDKWWSPATYISMIKPGWTLSQFNSRSFRTKDSADDVADYLDKLCSEDEDVVRFATAAVIVDGIPFKSYKEAREFYGISSSDFFKFKREHPELSGKDALLMCKRSEPRITWNEKHDKLLIDNFKKLGCNNSVLLNNFSITAIRSHARKLGLISGIDSDTGSSSVVISRSSKDISETHYLYTGTDGKNYYSITCTRCHRTLILSVDDAFEFKHDELLCEGHSSPVALTVSIVQALQSNCSK